MLYRHYNGFTRSLVMSLPPRATIADVARSAGVAVGTVSRVLNNHADVHSDIRIRVVNVARKLGYTRLRQRRRVGPGAKGTATGKATIGVLIFGMEDTLVQLPVVSAALQGIERSLSAQGRNLMLANIAAGDRSPPFLRHNLVEGLILKGPNQGLLPSAEDNPLLAELMKLPRVWLMGRLPNAVGDHCNFDTEHAGRLVAEHLQKKGHRQVAFMNPKPGQSQFERVKAAFTYFGHRLGLDVQLLESESHFEQQWPLPAITNQANVDELTQRWAVLPEAARPTAIFVPSDRTATQLYTALEQRGLKVGRNVSVVSCNNERSLLAHLLPALTSIDVHAEQIGRRAVDQLLWRIAHASEPTQHQILIEPTLIERDSVASL